MKFLEIKVLNLDIITAAFKYSADTHAPFILSLDLNDIGPKGYLSLEEVVQHIRAMNSKFPDAQISTLRRLKSGDLKTVFKSIETDSYYRFTYSAFDFTDTKLSRADVYNKYRQAIKFAQKNNFAINYIIGADNSRYNDIDSDLNLIKDFNTPFYYSIYSGSEVKEDEQTGVYNASIVQKCWYSANSNGVALREPYSDFLKPYEILQRKECFSVLSIGPELAIKGNDLFIEALEKYEVNYDKLAQEALKNKEWKKLLNYGDPEDGRLCLSLTAHKLTKSQEYSRLSRKIRELEPMLEQNIQQKYIEVFERYVTNFL